MNKPTVQDIFLRFYPAYLEKYSPSPEQAKVSRNIINCKTGAYGANVSPLLSHVPGCSKGNVDGCPQGRCT